MHLGQTGTALLLLGFISSCNSKSQDASKGSLGEQVSGEQNGKKEPVKPLPEVKEIPRDAAPPPVQIQSFESTSLQQAVVDLGKLEVLTIAHFRQAFPNQEIWVGAEELSSDNFEENASLSISGLSLSLYMKNFQLNQAGLSDSSERGITGIKVGNRFKKVFQNEQLECFYDYYEAGTLSCYLPDNW
ncbi:MAG: hypothetical protein JKY56_10970, partial [Kofleriaceae bacterium]|nr:hypothetical protein [Kofleriaceae bacterium]